MPFQFSGRSRFLSRLFVSLKERNHLAFGEGMAGAQWYWREFSVLRALSPGASSWYAARVFYFDLRETATLLPPRFARNMAALLVSRRY